MPRRKTSWWSSVVRTQPQALLRRAEGGQLVELLTAWWISTEGWLDGRWPTVDHSRRAARDRYTKAAFYALLETVKFPPLSDADEYAVDEIFQGFALWARGRKAAKLAGTLGAELGPLLDAATETAGTDAGQEWQREAQQQIAHGVHDQVHHHVHDQVHRQIHHEIHQQIHDQVHHAVHHQISHAAHHSGDMGGGHHGGGGGHH